MAGNDVFIRMTADEARVVRAWQEVNAKGPEAMERALKGVRTQAQGADRAVGTFMGGVLRDVGRFALYMTGIGSTIAGLYTVADLLRREYDELIRRRKASADTQLRPVDLMTEARAALGIDPTMSYPQLVDRVNSLITETGRDPSDIWARVNDALGARAAGTPAARALQVVETVARSGHWSPEAGKNLGGAVLDLMKVRRDLGPEDILGSMLKGHEIARVDEVADYAYHVNPFVAQGMAGGSSFEFLTSLVSAITQTSVDKSGRRTMNAATRLRQQMAQMIGPILGPTSSMEEQFGWLMSGSEESEKMRGRMLGIFADEMKKNVDTKGELTLEAKQFFPIIELLTPGGTTNRIFQEGLKEIPKLGQGSRDYLAQLERESAGIAAFRLADFYRKGKGAELGLQLNDPEAFKSVAGELLEDVLKAAGSGDAVARLARARLNVAGETEGVDSVEDVRERLEREEQRLRRGIRPGGTTYYDPSVGGVGTGAQFVREPTPAELRAAEALDKLGNRLDELITLMQQNAQNQAKPGKVELGPNVRKNPVVAP